MPKYSIIIPVYKNEGSINRLVASLEQINPQIPDMEVVFVVDGSPDQSFNLLKQQLASASFSSQLVAHSRNFGSFSAIRTGLNLAKGDFFGVMAADLQEPPELMIEFFTGLNNNDADVIIGTRSSRSDPWLSRLSSSLFWQLYRRWVVKEMPEGGVDIFGCNRLFRDQLLLMKEARSSLIAQIFWLGFRRKIISYSRLTRQEGKSAWTFRKKVDYMLDSIFAFTDYPIRLIIRIGALGSILSIVLAFSVLIAKLAGLIQVPGYAATVLILLVLGAMNLLALGLVGEYAWRAYENTKQRAIGVIHTVEVFNGK